MTLPLPDWIPWWGQLALVVVAILFGLAFLLMPFAVFGTRGRLDALEAQLDDIHAEIRMLAMRLPDIDRRVTRPVDPQPRPEPATPATVVGRDTEDWTQVASPHGDPEPILRRPPRQPPSGRAPECTRAEPTLRRPPS